MSQLLRKRMCALIKIFDNRLRIAFETAIEKLW